jgi:hypothetical protein
MPVTDIKRPNYYEGQYLGALDLVAAQEYQRQQDQRHRLAAHTWGIAVGLELEERPQPGGGNFVDVDIKPGYAVDGFGRTIVVLESRQLREELFAQFPPDPALPDGRWIPVWLRYREEKTDPPRPGFAACNVEEQAYRIRETFREVVGTLTTSQQRSKISVAGKSVDAEAEVADASVPYQALPEAGDGPLWLIPLGYVRWSGSHFVKSVTDDEQKKTREGRRYIGVIAASLLAPAEDLRLRPRAAFADADAADFASVEGRLRVDGRIVAKKDIFLHGGKLSFQNAGGQDENAPLWIQRRAGAGGAGSDLRAHIGEPGAATTRLTIGPGAADGSNEQVVLAVKGDDTVDIPTGILNFGSQTRQMINLWTTADGRHQYGIGVQSNTTYLRSHSEFCWFKDGVHHDDQSNPGAGGTLQLRLDDQARLHFGAQTRQMLNLWQTQYGIGVQSSTLYFRTDADFCWFRGGSHSNTRNEPGGGVLAMKLDSNSDLTIDGAVTARGNLLVGGGGNAEVIARHVNGKDWQSTSYDHLYLNYGTGRNVVVGNPQGTPSSLIVSGELFLGSTKVPVDVVAGVVYLNHFGATTDTYQLTLTSRLPNVAQAQIIVSLADIGNVNQAVDARWTVYLSRVPQRVNANTFRFDIGYIVGDSDGYLYSFSYVAIFVP